MRKTLILLAIALLPACNSQQSLQEIQDLSQKEVTAQSITTKKDDSFSKAYKATSKYFIKKSDTNNDKKLSAEEIKNNSITPLFNVSEKIVKEFDKDQDNLLSENEFATACRYSKDIYFNETGMGIQIDMELKHYDKNNDGVLSYNEATEIFNVSNSNQNNIDLMKNRYLVLEADSNRDGKIDRDELRDLFALRFEAYYNIAFEGATPNPVPSLSPNENILKIPFIKK